MSLVDDYENAVRSGNNPQLANYLAKMLAAQAGININSNDVEAAPAAMLTKHGDSTAPANGGDFWSGLSNFPLLGGIPGSSPGSIANAVSGVGDAVAGAAKTVGDVASGTSAAIKFITDIPRVITTLLGLILIIAGIFALAKGPAVNVVSSAIKGAITS